MNASILVQKLWNYCNVLHDDGMSYGDYVEQLTHLLFLKMTSKRRCSSSAKYSPICRLKRSIGRTSHDYLFC